MSVGGAISIYSFNVLLLTQGEYRTQSFTFIFHFFCYCTYIRLHNGFFAVFVCCCRSFFFCMENKSMMEYCTCRMPIIIIWLASLRALSLSLSVKCVCMLSKSNIDCITLLLYSLRMQVITTRKIATYKIHT